jgi:prohibitin 2
MKFPEPVAAAVNRKSEQYEAIQEFAYRLERERLESERKKVEALGYRPIPPNFWFWHLGELFALEGIEATLALARSPNSKVVVIGAPRDGVPLILGGLEGANVATPKNRLTS